MTSQDTISLEELEDEITDERQAVIKEMFLKNILSKNDLMKSINCIPVDCADINKCPCATQVPVNLVQHFQIPQLIEELGQDAVSYIGATDKSNSFKVYFSMESAKMNKYKRRGSDKPYVFIDKTPNQDGMFDCWLFNAPFVKNLTIVGVFKDLRQLGNFNCCEDIEYTDLGVISSEVKKRVLDKKLKVYRQLIMPPHQTDIVAR